MIISKRLLSGFGIVIIFAVIVGLIGITGMNRLRETNRSVYENQVLGLEYAGKASVAFEQTRLNSRQFVINNLFDDLKGATQVMEQFEGHAERFKKWIDMGMAIAAHEELTRFYTAILNVFENDYMAKARILFDEGIKDIPDHSEKLYINVLLESLIETGMQLETMVVGAIDLNTALVQHANIQSNSFTRLFIIIQTILLFTAISAALFIAFYITKSITTPISEAVEVLSRVAKGDFNARVRGKYKGELELMKDSVNEMAAKLADYLKVKVQEEKTRSFAAILSIADAGIVIKDKDDIVTDWNAGAEKILGYTHDEIIGKSNKSFTPEEHHFMIDDMRMRQLKGEHINGIEDIRTHKDGRQITCSASHTPLFDEDGQYSGTVVVFNDVTEKKLAEQKVRRFAAIIESAEACVITTDENFIVQGWNSGARNILGYIADEIIGKTPYFFAPESEWENINDIHTRMMQGERISRTDILQKHKDGNVIYCSAYYSPYFDDTGTFDGAVAVFHDITEKKKMEKELKEALRLADEASKIKSSFLANMSHEIRTPMNAVISMTDMLLDENLTPKQHRYLTDIKISGANLLGIINDILDFSKIESGKFEIVPVHFEFDTLLDNLRSTFDFVAGEKGLRFISNKRGETPKYLFGDDIRIRQVLTNLLGNAVKFTESGNVMLNTYADERNIYFDVCDTGIGIKEEDIGKLFDSFQQIDSSSNRTKTGTGLGLTITKSLVEIMGGAITVQSEYGVGTSFYVSIPREDGDPEKIMKVATGNILNLKAPEAAVLVVDDYEANLRVASGLLEQYDIDCDIAHDGNTALRMVQQKQYDIVFMDHMMPGMDGIETMLCIRELGGANALLPIVALTANAISGVKEMLIEQGMDDFLSKPIDRAQLTQVLKRWLPEEKVNIERPCELGKGQRDNRVSEFISGLRNIPEINLDAALELLGGLEDLYESAFMFAHRKLPENLSMLDAHIQKGSLYDFAVEIHGLKGVLNSIGCQSLGVMAANLEKASKGENKAYCLKHYPDFKRRVWGLYDDTAPIIERTRQSAKMKGDDAFLRERLASVRQVCEEYDSLFAHEILSGLSNYTFDNNTDALIHSAMQAAEQCDHDAVLEIISRIEQ